MSRPLQTSRSAHLSDLLLPLAVVAVVGMMVFPLPAAVLDILLMLNITFALCLLICAVYLAEPGRFTALPTILLLATLFRLGLNISTTRQLLAVGEAPDVVAAFGSFVVSGNLVVGIVIFGIVTLVQFLVIAKGAERIAEVAARFTLDAMPGAQMSIDADLRAGIIGLAEAKEKRLELHRESKLYGALDGAMKFVKGDAIAGLLITLINITAGLIVGVSQQGLGFAAAGQKYTIFTIGDGLVSQIPALLVAVGAGIAVTRVDNGDYSFVGRDVFSQLGKEPQALATTGGVLAALSLVPGLPTVPFLTTAFMFFVFASKGQAERQKEEMRVKDSQFSPKLLSVLTFRFSQDALFALKQEGRLAKGFLELRGRVFEQWGVVLPDAQFDVDESLEELRVEIRLHGVDMLSIHWAQAEKVEEGNNAGLSEKVLLTAQDFLLEHLSEFLDDTHTRRLLELHSPLGEDLLNSVVGEVLSVTALTSILRALVREGVSIKELRAILQAIAEYHTATKDGALYQTLPGAREQLMPSRLKALYHTDLELPHRSGELLAEVREALGRSISKSMTEENWELEVYLLAAELDQLFVKIALSGASLSPSIAEAIFQEVSLLQREGEERQRVVILSSKYARSTLAQLLEGINEVSVISVREIAAEVQLSIAGEVGASMSPGEKSETEPEILAQRHSDTSVLERKAA